MFVCSDIIISFVLGSQWMEASPLFRILAVAGLLEAVSSTTGLVFITSGRSREYLRFGVAITPLICLAFVFGLPWGAKGVAIAYAIVKYIVLFPTLIYAYKETPIQISDFFKAIYKPFLASIAMGSACFVLISKLYFLSDLALLMVCSFVALSIYLIATIVVSGGTKDLRELYSYGRLVLTKK
jgi:PST family polysaccharide transporter